MIRLALVEDDELYRSQLREYIDKYSAVSGEKFTVTEFSDGDEIALGYKAVYDIILMDIEMKFMGWAMMAAEEIRKVDTEVIIIFITNSPQYAIKGYAVDALDYVLKPVSYYAFSQRLGRAVERVARRARHFLQINATARRLSWTPRPFIGSRTAGMTWSFTRRNGEVTAPGSMTETRKNWRRTVISA